MGSIFSSAARSRANTSKPPDPPELQEPLPKIQLNVNTLAGDALQLPMRPDETIGDVKVAVEEQLGHWFLLQSLFEMDEEQDGAAEEQEALADTKDVASLRSPSLCLVLAPAVPVGTLLEKLYLCDKTLGGQMDFGIPGCDKGWIEGRGTYLVANYWCPIRVVETSETVDHFRFEYVGFESSANYNWDEWYLAGRVVPVARGGCKASTLEDTVEDALVRPGRMFGADAHIAAGSRVEVKLMHRPPAYAVVPGTVMAVLPKQVYRVELDVIENTREMSQLFSSEVAKKGTFNRVRVGPSQLRAVR